MAQDIINGMTQMAFAYGGHVLMLDMMRDMKRPLEFYKSVWLSQIFMFLNYAVVGFLGYHVYGTAVMAPITLNLPKVRKNRCDFDPELIWWV